MATRGTTYILRDESGRCREIEATSDAEAATLAFGMMVETGVAQGTVFRCEAGPQGTAMPVAKVTPEG